MTWLLCVEAQEFKKQFEEAMAHNDKVLGAEGEGEVRFPLPAVHCVAPRVSLCVWLLGKYLSYCMCTCCP